MRRTTALALITVVAGALAGGAAGAIVNHDDSANAGSSSIPAVAASAATEGALTPQQIYARAAPGVVVITATETQKVPATAFTPPQTQQVQSLGSGFVIDRRGNIVTNQHVVAGARNIRVGFSSGATYPATVVGSDASTDIAVVRVKASSQALHPLQFDASAALSGGDPVYAIGNPFGLDRTMTAGIVSATGRDIQAPNGLTIDNAIQTDAAINHGNSGGPLLDARGRVVGVNAQIEGGTVDANVGVGFAIPSDTAESIEQQLIEHGRAEHGFLGVEGETIDPSAARAMGGLPATGVIVARVDKNSPAAKAGLRAATRQQTVAGQTMLLGGDVIVAVDGTPVRDAPHLGNAIEQHKPGDKVTLKVVREGATRTVEVTLGAAPGSGS
jgi:putative serine protease PepD